MLRIDFAPGVLIYARCILVSCIAFIIRLLCSGCKKVYSGSADANQNFRNLKERPFSSYMYYAVDTSTSWISSQNIRVSGRNISKRWY